MYDGGGDDEKKLQRQHPRSTAVIDRVESESLSMASAVMVQVNVMMGMGPLILPMVFYEAGVVLSTAFMVIIAFSSFTNAEFLVEAMAICNYVRGQQKRYKESQKKIVGGERDRGQVNGNCELMQDGEMFGLKEKVEISEMGSILLGKRFGKYAVSPLVLVYLLGVMVTKCLTAAKVASAVFEGSESLKVFSSKGLWLVLFFIVSAAFSFGNVSSTKKLQVPVFVVRALTIGMLVLTTVIIGSERKDKEGGGSTTVKQLPLFDVSNFHGLFSNVVFAFMMHHSIPSMVTPIKPERDVKPTLKATFFIGLAVCFFLSFLASLCFGETLVGSTGVLKLFHENFKDRGSVWIDAVYYLASFYAFLNITSFPVMTITARETLMGIWNKSSENNEDKRDQGQQRGRIISTCSVLLVTVILSVFVDNIQALINVVAGVFGAIILLIIPPVLVIKARNAVNWKVSNEYKEFNLHKTTFREEHLPILSLATGGLLIAYATISILF